MKIDKIRVELYWREHRKQLVGEIVRDGRNIHFKYAKSYLDKGNNLSPIKLPFNSAIHTGKAQLFDGLLGVFNDSLPDGWGRLLLDRALASQGKDPFSLTPLERLAYVGEMGAGALTYTPVLASGDAGNIGLSLDDFAKASQQVLEGDSTYLVEELYQIGGSSGGAQPKIQVGYHEKTGSLLYGKEMLPEGYEHWLIKFPSSYDFLDIAHIEYAYYLMALEAGIEMMPSQLFRGKSGQAYFGTKRFDRVGNRRLHLHSASGLLHDDFRHSQMDYGHLMDAAFILEQNAKAYQKVLRLAAFNIYSHNQDDHSKNFAFLMDMVGKWRFAPAYDLTFSRTAHNCQSTMTAGEYQYPSKKQLLKLAQIFKVNQVTQIIEEVQEAIAQWPRFAKEAGVSQVSMKLIGRVLEEVRKRG